MNPTVSVLIALCNKAPFVSTTIRSVQSQSLQSWEVIVVDNKSTDDGPHIVAAFAKQDPRIRLITAERRGPGAARNLALQQAQGEWVLFLDADDLIEPLHLERLLEASNANPVARVIVASWREFANEQFSALRFPPLATSAIDDPVISSIAYPPWPLGAAMVQRRVLSRDFYWDEDLDHFMSEDTVFWFRVLQFNKYAVSNYDGFRYRVHVPGSRNQPADLHRWLQSQNRVHLNNLRFANSHGVNLDWRHYDRIMRCYIPIWRQAHIERLQPVERHAHNLAKHYLDHALAAGGWRKPSLVLRKLCGFRVVAFVRHLRWDERRPADHQLL